MIRRPLTEWPITIVRVGVAGAEAGVAGAEAGVASADAVATVASASATSATASALNGPITTGRIVVRSPPNQIPRS